MKAHMKLDDRRKKLFPQMQLWAIAGQALRAFSMGRGSSVSLEAIYISGACQAILL